MNESLSSSLALMTIESVASVLGLRARPVDLLIILYWPFSKVIVDIDWGCLAEYKSSLRKMRGHCTVYICVAG